jgi:hypothetical protein
MSQSCEWYPIVEKPSVGIRSYVERNGQLGYAKFESAYIEKLAADLAQLVCVPVPRVEIGVVKGMSGPAAISHVHSLRSEPLCTDDEIERDFSPSEIAALKAASGLLPFLAWIGANDHNKHSNFVVDDLGNDLRRIVAIDFEDAFPWTKQDELEEKVIPPKPPGLSVNHDRHLVNSALQRIEELDPAEIDACCRASGISSSMADTIARGLRARQRLLRDRLRELGWLG